MRRQAHLQKARNTDNLLSASGLLILRSRSFAIFVRFLKHHIFYLHQPDLRASLILIQLHGNILDRCLCLWNSYMLQRIYTAPCLLNLGSHELTCFLRLRKLQHIRQNVCQRFYGSIVMLALRYRSLHFLSKDSPDEYASCSCGSIC